MLIVPAFIYPNTFPWVWLKIFCGLYPKQTYIIASPVGLWKVVVRVPVECNWFLTSIDCFYLSQISFKFFAQDFLCWFLTCLFFIYWVSVSWSWNFSLGVIENCLWGVSKPHIHICFPCRLGCVFRRNFVYSGTFLSYPVEQFFFPYATRKCKGNKKKLQRNVSLPGLQLIYIRIS